MQIRSSQYYSLVEERMDAFSNIVSILETDPKCLDTVSIGQVVRPGSTYWRVRHPSLFIKKKNDRLKRFLLMNLATLNRNGFFSRL